MKVTILISHLQELAKRSTCNIFTWFWQTMCKKSSSRSLTVEFFAISCIFVKATYLQQKNHGCKLLESGIEWETWQLHVHTFVLQIICYQNISEVPTQPFNVLVIKNWTFCFTLLFSRPTIKWWKLLPVSYFQWRGKTK